MYEKNNQNTVSMLNQVSTFVDTTLIKNIEEMVTMISLDSSVVGAEDILNYLNITSDQTIQEKSDSQKAIESYFKTIKESHRDIHFLFMGLEDGSYIEYPLIYPEENYDPRTRSWYESTTDSEHIRISNPYITKVTEDMIVSFTKPIITDYGKSGVIGIAVNIDNLTDILSQVKIENSGYILVLNQNNKIVVSPKHEEWLLKTPEELGIEPLMELSNGKNYNEGTLDGKETIFSMVTLEENGWSFISVSDKTEIIDKTKDLRIILLSIYFIVLLFIVLIVNIVSNYITKPILAISKSLEKVAYYNFDTSTDAVIMKHINKKDEIGTIAKAIHYLLEKVHLSFNVIKASNKEINEKNQILTDSEKILKDQLVKIEAQGEYIEFLAYHDSLTMLPNRRQFLKILETALVNNEQGGVILLDLDNFKSLNDTLGHAFGDKVLTTIAKRLQILVSEDVFISRFGGDEFLFLVKNKSKEEIEALTMDIRHIFSKHIIVAEHNIDIQFSIGISIFPEDSNDVNQLIMNADLALYSVKNRSKNSYQFFDKTLADMVRKKATIEALTKEAIEEDGFKLVYQPQIDSQTGEVHAYEALLRFKKHIISPAEFIPIAEENGTIIAIGRIVTGTVIKQLAVWIEQGHDVKPISINYSAAQLHDSQFLEFIKEELIANQVDPRLIEIEITENIFLENKTGTLDFLEKLHELGIKISIDDFGTGYSSFSYLTFLPLDKLKLDKSINDRFLTAERIKVMDALILLAHSLNLLVVAEGIETSEQYRMLEVGKCDFIQGYFFSKPLEAEAVVATFNKNYLGN